ncbi:hypothetical protein HNR65_003417 [Desulfosalsimonas propionicica]|uniref:J domain-containing protein n=1 Tax=Desulfosalsimonas propionicica TaxID=332175 RepID=A0A7W0CC81_9BACT|nr:J domain-containing protein [Desulfosalsimonas propionicica]MBA2883060.1 hypothetical protein [Desulfosalsimonas propionicica]
MKMPFGKYRGFEVDEIPEDYLRWLVKNVNLREPLRSSVFEALDEHPEREILPEQATIKTIYRRLSMKYHPDKGGDTAAMQAINDFYAELTKMA